MIYDPIVFSDTHHNQTKFFPVKETPVRYADPIDPSLMRTYPNRKVIINFDRNIGISLVRENFLAVEHSQAFDLGKELFQMLFGVTPQVHKEYMSASSTDYYVDLISETCKFVLDSSGYHFSAVRRRVGDFNQPERPHLIREFNAPEPLHGAHWIKRDFQDVYRPFLRVSNFLRDNNSFYIELGFYRDRCTNGMLLGMRSKTVFKQSYFVSNFNTIRQNAFEFFEAHNKSMFVSMERLWKLLSMPIAREHLHLISFDIYGEEIEKRNMDDRKYLQKLIHELVEAYDKEIGENMNAALNVATDLSKRLETGRGSLNKLQRRAAQWMFKVTAKSFRMAAYLKELEGIEERVMTAKVNEDIEIVED